MTDAGGDASRQSTVYSRQFSSFRIRKVLNRRLSTVNCRLAAGAAMWPQ